MNEFFPWKAIADFLTSWRRDWSAGAASRKRKIRLRKMLLDDRFKWRTIDQLSNGIGADRQMTQSLLIEIGARPSETDSTKWGLETRNQL
jgi:hypothetical protein